MLKPISPRGSAGGGSSPSGGREPGSASRLFGALYGAKVVFIWLLLATGLAVVIASGWTWYADRRDNQVIAALLAGQNVEIDPETASSQVLFARAYFLLKRDRIEEAQVLLDQANFRGRPEDRVHMLYDMANKRLIATFDAIEQGQFDKATSLVGLAKDDYNEALRLDPQAWNVKYNLDVAARLVRDLPQAGELADEENPEPSKKLWSDLPGVPRGEP